MHSFLPADEAQRYAAEAEQALGRASLALRDAQYLLVVDRDPQVQAVLLFWRSAQGGYVLVGASPVSTGSPGSFDHFETPLGVFEHGPWNPDFRAEGAFNSNGIRGYGVKGMRVFDFGWQRVPKGWGDGAVIEMRLQMHATDPDALESRLGSPQSSRGHAARRAAGLEPRAAAAPPERVGALSAVSSSTPRTHSAAACAGC